jgi:hypothetical protein
MILVLSFNQAVALRLRLAGVVCSQPWLEHLLSYNGQGWHFDRTCYPPGGQQTAMQECNRCGRIAPTQSQDVALCVDCVEEAAEHQFHQRWQRAPVYLRAGLLARWWASRDVSGEQWMPRRSDSPVETPELVVRRKLAPSSFRFYDPIARKSLAGLPVAVAEKLWRAVQAVAGRVVDSTRAITTTLRRIISLAGTWRIRTQRRCLILQTPIRCYCLLRYERDGLIQPDTLNGRRAVGCHIPLLPDSQNALQREIHYFHEHGKIIPSARRELRERRIGSVAC